MTTDNPRAVIGGNAPPDQIDTISAPFEDQRGDAENWLDGETVIETEAQMLAVDETREVMRQWRLGLEAGQKEATAPLYATYMGELNRWKPTIADAKRIEAGLVSVVDAFKRALAAQKEAARKEAERLAWEATRAAQELARNAQAADLDATRAASQAMADAEAAQALAKAAGKDTVKGLRTVHLYEITDHKALLNWIAKNDRAAVTAFIEQYAKDHHKQGPMNGVKTWTDKVAV